MKQHPTWPFIFVAFVPGVLLGRSYGWLALAICLFAVALGMLFFHRRDGVLWRRLFAVIFLTGWCCGGVKFKRMAEEQAFVDSLGGRRVGFTCWVGSDVVRKTLPKGSTCWEFTAYRGQFAGCEQTLAQPAVVSWFAPPHVDEFAPRPGELWTGAVRVKTGRFERLMVSCGSRDFRLAEEQPQRPVLLMAKRWQAALNQRLQIGISERQPEAALLSALVLGKASAMPKVEKQVFRNTGTSHVFAVSGQHVAIVAGLVAAVLSMCRLGRRYWGLVLIPLVLLYTLTTGASPSAVRACLMAVFYFAAPLFHRRSSIADALLMTGVLVYAFYPLQGVEVGWQLSFAVMVGFAYGLPLSRQLREYWLARKNGECPSPVRDFVRAWFGMEELWADIMMLNAARGQAEPQERIRLKVRQWLQGMITAVECSLIAWVMTLPLVVYYFGRVSVLGIVVNLFISFFAVGALSMGLIGSLVGFVWPWAAGWLNMAAAGLMQAMLGIVRLADGLQGELPQFPEISVWPAVCYYILLAAFYLLAKRFIASSKVPFVFLKWKTLPQRAHRGPYENI